MDELQQQTAPPPVMPKKYLFGILGVAIVLVVVAGALMYAKKKTTPAEDVKTAAGQAVNLAPSALDTDHDGLSDADEVKLGTDATKVDTDADGLSDAVEVNITKTDPKNPKSKDPALTDYEWVRKQRKR